LEIFSQPFSGKRKRLPFLTDEPLLVFRRNFRQVPGRSEIPRVAWRGDKVSEAHFLNSEIPEKWKFRPTLYEKTNEQDSKTRPHHPFRKLIQKLAASVIFG
jgi:hypothetical protein